MDAVRIGDFEIYRLSEFEGPAFPIAEFFPDFNPEVVRENAEFLGPRLIEPETGMLVMSFHSFVLKTPHHRILIDTCLGNDKERPTRPRWDRLKTSYLADLGRIGLRPEDIDYVMCTHLHWDHVGWNTRLVDGKWVPTFPKARYVMARREFGHWEEVHKRNEDTPHRLAFDDSILPVVKSGQAMLVGDDFALEDGLQFEGAPGHTPGNIVIHARSRDERGIFMGDVIHHPIQLFRPEWSSRACSDLALSRRTRERLIAEHAELQSLVLPAHFPAPTVGRIVRHGRAFRFTQ
jgi:glyoxylase-like metal-dependent hydrolase (beta-lactamase superfamily II)